MKKVLRTPFVWLLLVLFTLAGCAAKLERPAMPVSAGAMITVTSTLPIADDQDKESLNAAIETSIRYYERAGGGARYCFHEACYYGREMIDALRVLQGIVRSDTPWAEKAIEIQKSFELYQSIGNDGLGTVLVTGYYEPILDGSLIKTEKFRYPLYSVPGETVTVRLDRFNPKYGKDLLVGRLKGKEVVPHYSRKEIDSDHVLAGRGLEIGWVDDPVALFILHIQGSGQIRLPDGKILRVNYAQKNGKPFRGLTTYMVKKGFLTEAEKGYPHMKSYLQTHPAIRDDIMNYNESYVFFRVVDEGPIGSLGLPIVASRSIATDPAVFPKGAAGVLVSRKPVLNKEGQVEAWTPYTRIIFSHDAGGAIKGPGRVDLFCGTGDSAESVAGSLKERGRLYFLAPRRQ